MTVSWPLNCTQNLRIYCAIIVGVYIPPENTVYGRQGGSFFENLTNILYENANYDCTFLMGVFNSRVACMSDFVENVDNIPNRACLDETDNSHGNLLIDFLLECKMCILNDRICPLNDSYTCLSH